jgi:hypothetical protein
MGTCCADSKGSLRMPDLTVEPALPALKVRSASDGSCTSSEPRTSQPCSGPVLDLRTVMKLSGHSDLASVMRYLRPAEGTEVQNRVNAIQWR